MMLKKESNGLLYVLMGIMSIFLFLTHDLEVSYSKLWLIEFFLIATGILVFIVKSFPPAIMIGAVASNLIHITQDTVTNVSLSEQGLYTLAVATVITMIMTMFDTGDREKGDISYLSKPLAIYSYSVATLLTVQYI